MGVTAVTSSSWRYLLFDLDNTLYSDEAGLLTHIDQRINYYLAARLGLAMEDINRLRREYWLRYGTTLRGVKETHGLDPREYIAYAYDIDVTRFLQPDARLAIALQRLPWPKAIFTNSPACHARSVLDALGVADRFERIFDIGFSAHRGKPDPETYRMVLAALGVSGAACVMIDDCAVNLRPARNLGMTTIYLGQDEPEWADYHLSSILALEEALLGTEPASSYIP